MAGLFGEFSSPNNAFAAGLFFEPPSLENLFADVWFDRQPHCIKLKRMVTVRKGNLEVHFRDSNHLRCLLEETPNLSADLIYFVLDKDTRDGEEFMTISGTMEHGKFIHVMADEPLNPQGVLNSPYPIVFPLKSDIDHLPGIIKGGISTSLKNYKEGLDLATTIDTFDRNILELRTDEAKKLYEERKRDRFENPEKYPDFDTLTPEKYWITDGEVQITEDDYLESSNHIFYMAPSVSEIEQVQEELKDFGRSEVYFINSYLDAAGVYSLDPLFLRRGFKFSATQNLIISDKYHLPDENFRIETGKTLYGLGCNIRVGGSIYFYSKRNLYLASITPGFLKPNDMPVALWNHFTSYWFITRDIQLNDTNGMEKNFSTAIQLFRETVELGNESAKRILAIALNSHASDFIDGTNGVEQNLPKAVELFRESAELGYALAQRNLAIALNNHAGDFFGGTNGMEKNFSRAIELLRESVELGHEPAKGNLAIALNTHAADFVNGTNGAVRCLPRAIELLRESVELGYEPAQRNLDQLLMWMSLDS